MLQLKFEDIDRADANSFDDNSAVDPSAMLSGPDFHRFWGVDIWGAIASGGKMATGKDFDAIRTAPEDETEAMAACAEIENYADRYPRLLGWMKAPALEQSVGVFMIGSFLKKKTDAIMTIAMSEEAA